MLVKAQNTFAKDKIALNRLMGLPAEQELTLTDTVPYADLAEMTLDEAKALAYQRRKDLLELEAQLEVAERSRKAVKYERMPSLGVQRILRRAGRDPRQLPRRFYGAGRAEDSHL